MSKKPDTAAALASILKAKRGEDHTSNSGLSVVTQAEPDPPPTPPPALPAPAPILRGRGGKSSDPDYRQCSVYIHKTVRKKIGRALDDDDKGQDFSELVEELLLRWLEART